MNPYRYFDARRCNKICEMIRHDFDEIKSNTRLIRIDKGILKGMYPKVKDKYLDSCYENLKSNGDIVTDNNFVDWYKKRE